MVSDKIELQFLCKSLNDIQVLYDPVYSHAATHFNDAPTLKDIVIDIISNKALIEEKYEFDTDMQRIVGDMDVVDVNSEDELLYAKRKNRDEFVPFVKNRTQQPTCLVSMGLLKIHADKYLLTSAWFGELDSPPFPGETVATSGSIPFWNTHAFVWGSQGVQEETITDTYPW